MQETRFTRAPTRILITPHGQVAAGLQMARKSRVPGCTTGCRSRADQILHCNYPGDSDPYEKWPQPNLFAPFVRIHHQHSRQCPAKHPTQPAPLTCFLYLERKVDEITPVIFVSRLCGDVCDITRTLWHCWEKGHPDAEGRLSSSSSLGIPQNNP